MLIPFLLLLLIAGICGASARPSAIFAWRMFGFDRAGFIGALLAAGSQTARSSGMVASSGRDEVSIVGRLSARPCW